MSMYMRIKFALLALPAVTLAQQPGPATQPVTEIALASPAAHAAAPLRARVMHTQGFASGELLALSPAAATVRGAAGEQQIATAELAVLQFFAPPPKPASHDVLLFRTGDRLVGSFETDAGQLVFEHAVLALADNLLDPARLTGVVLQSAFGRRDYEDLLALAETGADDRDVIYLANGDSAEGTFLGVDEGQLKFRVEAGEVLVPPERVLALTFAERAVPQPPPPADLVYLADGSVLQARDLQLVDDRSRFRAPWTSVQPAGVDLPAGFVRRIELASTRPTNPARRFVWLTEIELRRQDHTPFVSLSRQPRRDRAVTGGPIKLPGDTAALPRGWGMQSQALLSFRTDLPAQRLLALVAINETGSAFSNADVRVLADGTERFKHESLMLGDEPLPVVVPLNNARRLELVVDFGLYGDIGDHVNWIDAALVVGN